jgi:transposase
MCNKQEVYHYYFIEGKKASQIANILNVNKSTITRVLSQFPEYSQEKERRKKENKENHLQKTKNYIKEKRGKEKRVKTNTEAERAIKAKMDKKHRIDVFLLSIRKTVSTRQLIEYCLGGYIFDNQTGKYFFDETYGLRPSDLPKSYKTDADVLPQFRMFANNIEREKWTSTTESEALQ